ncbi:MAG: hypothetical protein MJ239_01565 [Bacilli bacterium]|nr:hypothetical protein [Bacilli bacterium]
MKKQIVLLTILSSMLVGCGGGSNSESSTPSYPSSWNIVTPTGAPAIAFYNHAKNPHFTTNSTPSNIVAMMNSQSDKEVVVIDTVSGIKAINKGAPYKLASTITLGNFYIAATGNDDDGVMNEGDTIVLFGQNQTPDLIFHYLYGDKFDASIEYVTAVSNAAQCLASGKNIITSSTVDYVFVAQPVLFATLNNQSAPTYGKSSVYADVQELYKEKSGGKSMIQASVFVKDSVNETERGLFLDKLKSDIENGIANPDLIKAGMDELSEEEQSSIYGIKSTVAKAVVGNGNTVGLGYVKAKENKAAIDAFISLFGMEPTNEEIFVK